MKVKCKFMFFYFIFNSLVSILVHAQDSSDVSHWKTDCANGVSATIGAVGDFLMHDPLQKKAGHYKTFKLSWQKWLPYTQAVDIMYGNLETPVAPGLNRKGQEVPDTGEVRFDNLIYTSYALFNLHPQLLKDIKDSGWDIVSTANNHSLDRGVKGVEKTIDELNKVNLTYVGTRKQNEDTDDMFYRIIEENGISTAWIACTAVYNISDPQNAVLGCQKDESYILDLIKYLKNKVDAVIVTPHWGDEMSEVNSYQKQLARKLIEAGALAVIGAHPHVLQKMEKYISSDGRETLIAYSLGNFLSFHPSILQKTTVMLFVNLVKEGSSTKIQGVLYMPAVMRNRTGDFKDVELLPINQNGQLIDAKELPSEIGKNYASQAINRIFSLYPKANLIEHGASLDFSRFCQ